MMNDIKNFYENNNFEKLNNEILDNENLYNEKLNNEIINSRLLKEIIIQKKILNELQNNETLFVNSKDVLKYLDVKDKQFNLKNNYLLKIRSSYDKVIDKYNYCINSDINNKNKLNDYKLLLDFYIKNLDKNDKKSIENAIEIIIIMECLLSLKIDFPENVEKILKKRIEDN